MFESIRPTLQQHSEEHDRWSLNEVSAKTFPATDVIAYKSAQQFLDSPKAEEGLNVDGCSFDKDSERKSLETPIECVHCRTKIPATVALNFEGADYVYQFCGPQCIYAWYITTNLSEK